MYRVNILTEFLLYNKLVSSFSILLNKYWFYLTLGGIGMNTNKRKISRLIIGIIWIVGSVITGISGQVLIAIIFALVGILFLFKGIKLEKGE